MCVVVSGVDESVCGVNSVMTAGELDVCGCDSVVSDEAGESGGVEIFVSVCDVAWLMTHCCPMWFVLVTVCRWLLTRCCVVLELARSGREDNGPSVVFGPGLAPPGEVDGLVCADGSLWPEPPPINAMCLRCCVLLCFIVFCCVLLFILVFYCCVLLFYHRT